MTEYTIDELARRAGTNVRNVRAYQDRRLLPPPRKKGRGGIYTDVHLSRLRVVGELLERGYSLRNIGEILHALERGQPVAELVGLEHALVSPWSPEAATYFTMEELSHMFGQSARPEALHRAVELGVFEREGSRVRVPSPRLVHAGAELVRAGIPLHHVLDQLADLRTEFERIARRIVRFVEKHLFDVFGKDRLPSASEIPRLTGIVKRLRPLALSVVEAESARAIERAIAATIGRRLDRAFRGRMRAGSTGPAVRPQNRRPDLARTRAQVGDPAPARGGRGASRASRYSGSVEKS